MKTLSYPLRMAAATLLACIALLVYWPAILFAAGGLKRRKSGVDAVLWLRGR